MNLGLLGSKVHSPFIMSLGLEVLSQSLGCRVLGFGPLPVDA